jgi:nicotinamidase-related amidase
MSDYVLLDPDSTAVLVVDMINDYVHSDGRLFAGAGQSIIPNLEDIVAFARENDIGIYYVNSAMTDEDEPMAEVWGLHAEKGRWGSEVTAEIEPQPDDTIVEKRLYNGFAHSDLDYLLQNDGIKTVAVAGVDTHVCVRSTAEGAFNHGYDVIGLEECVDTADDEKHRLGLEYIDQQLGETMTNKEFKRSAGWAGDDLD